MEKKIDPLNQFRLFILHHLNIKEITFNVIFEKKFNEVNE
jgi:hypothetical protein